MKSHEFTVALPHLSSSKDSLAKRVKKNFDFFVRASERAEIESVRMTVADAAIEVIVRDLQKTGDAAGINPHAQRRWIAANFGHESSLAGEYSRYAKKISGEKSIEALVDRTIAAARPGNVSAFLTRVMDRAPLFGLVTTSLYEDANDSESKLSQHLNGANRPIDEWYPEVIRESARAFSSIESIFRELSGRCKTDDQKKALRPFLEAWKTQLQLYVLDCINLLNGFVMHLEKEDCAVMYSTTDFQIYKDRFAQLQRQLLELQGHKVFGPQTKNDKVNYCGVFSKLARPKPYCNEKGRTKVTIPTMISAMDVCSLVFFFSDFFDNFKSGLMASPRLYANTCIGDTATYIPLTGRGRVKMATIQLRSEEDDNGQARIKLIGNGRFNGFDLRLDRDTVDDRDQLTMDIGSADLGHALDYAKAVGEMSDQHEIVMNYSRIYGAREPKATEPKYPSVFDMAVNGGSMPYNLGNKVALVSAVAMKNATVNGLRNSEIYLHHSRDKEITAFTSDFPRIVKMLREVLLGR